MTTDTKICWHFPAPHSLLFPNPPSFAWSKTKTNCRFLYMFLSFLIFPPSLLFFLLRLLPRYSYKSYKILFLNQMGENENVSTRSASTPTPPWDPSTNQPRIRVQIICALQISPHPPYWDDMDPNIYNPPAPLFPLFSPRPYGTRFCVRAPSPPWKAKKQNEASTTSTLEQERKATSTAQLNVTACIFLAVRREIGSRRQVSSITTKNVLQTVAVQTK